MSQAKNGISTALREASEEEDVQPEWVQLQSVMIGIGTSSYSMPGLGSTMEWAADVEIDRAVMFEVELVSGHYLSCQLWSSMFVT